MSIEELQRAAESLGFEFKQRIVKYGKEPEYILKDPETGESIRTNDKKWLENLLAEFI